MNKRQAAMPFIFITLLIDIIGIGLIAPILPKLIEQFTGGTTSSASYTYGLLTAIYALMQFLFAPVIGSLSDQYGRRPVILVSLLGLGLDYILLATATSLPIFFVARVIAGITGASITAASAYIADVSPPEKRAQNFGLIGAAFGLGFIIGPALGGILGGFGVRVPFYVAAGLTLVNWLYGFFILPESLKPENRRKFDWARANPVGSLVALGRYPMVLSLAGSIFLTNLAQNALQSTWVLYTSYRYNWNITQTGISLAIVGLTSAIVQGGLIRVLIPKLGEKRAVIVGQAITATSFLLYGLAPEGWMIYLILVFGALGGIGAPATQGLISRGVEANEQGAVQGSLASLASITGVIGPLIATSAFGYFTSGNAPVQIPGIAFFLGSGFVAAALLIAVRTFRNPAFSTPRNAELEPITPGH